eukprot:518627-Prymnesium_polylepis.1
MEAAIITSCRNLGVSCPATRGGGAAQARRDTLVVRAPGVTMTATMRHPLVPRLSTDALPHRTSMETGGEAHREH